MSYAGFCFRKKVTGGTVSAAALSNSSTSTSDFGLVGSELAGTAAAGRLVRGALVAGKVAINRASSGSGRIWCTVFFFNDTATTEIYTLSLHDALPISLSALNVFGLLTGSFDFALSRTSPA